MTSRKTSLRALGLAIVPAALAGLLAASASGCAIDPSKPLFGDSSPGELGNTWLSFGQSYGCTFLSSCDLSRPLESTASETITVTVVDPQRNDRAGDLKFSTSDEHVMSVITQRLVSEPTDPSSRVYAVDVQAIAAGEVDFVIERADATVLDRAKIRVREPARFVVAADPFQALASNTVTVGVGQPVSLIGDVYDAAGEHLLANEEVIWTVEDADVADLGRYGLGGSARSIDEDRVVITGRRVGTTVLHVRVAGIEQTLNVVAVTPPSG